MDDRSNVQDKQVQRIFFVHPQIDILLTDLALSQVAGEYGSSREPAILTAKCQNLRVIIEKVHRQIKFKTKSK